uniref:Glycosyl transferase 48 domain-containing protein n=1 Tax=Arcella intermedia TaxID=1963864 RepID=A0A6B2KXJ2_9EUKA
MSTQPLRRDKFQDIPKSTILIPVYEEKLEFAWRDNPRAPYAPLDEARHLIAKYPVHWLNLQERIAEEGKRKIFYPDASKRPPRVAPLVKSKMIFSSIEEYRNYHIANWLSMHDQLVYRTVKGAASYFKSLTFLAQLELERELQSTEKRKDLAKRKAQEKIEIVLCFQTYQGNYFEVSPIIHKWLKKWPFLKVCYDYKRDTNLKTEMINNIPPLYDYATVCLTWEAEPNGKETLVHRIIPRENPLLLVNTAGERIQGKAMNQLNGLMFLTGQFLQVLDANQGGHATEYLKFPALLENFKVNKVTGIPRRRIIGAREFIFTAALGRVANYHAYQEWSFGTLVLRVYSDLGIRLHYGHPDVFHAPWARGHSGLSKINPNINTSEDVFAGFETMLSKERTKHLEHIQFEKGRETGLQNMTGFDMKISAGNACLLRSRDMYHLTERLPLVKRFLFFYGIAGHFLTNTMMVISMYWYIWALFFFSLAGVSLQAIGGTIFATEWLLHAGFTTVIPLFAELLVERGPTLGFLEALLFVPISTIVYLFQMQSKHAGFVHGMVTGTSAHINTGRGLQIYRRSSHVLFTTYAHTHLYPMFEIITITVCYWSIAKELNGGSLPMIMIYVFCFCVLSAPQLFNPTLKGSTLPEVLRDIIQFVSWIGKPSSLNSIKDWENNMKEITEADAEFIRYSAQKDKESLPTGKIGIAFVLAHFFFSFGFWLAIAIFLLYPTMQYWLVFFLEGWFYYILFYAIFSCLPFISKSWSAYITPVSLLLLLAWGIGFVVVLVVFSSNRRVPWTEVGISFFIFIKLLAAFRTCILNFVIVAAFHKFPSKIEEKLKDKQQRNAFIMYFIVFTNHIFLTSSLRSTMALLWGFYSFIIGLLMRPLWGNLFLFGRFTGLAPIEVVGSDGARMVLDPEKIEETILKPLQQWKLTNK